MWDVLKGLAYDILFILATASMLLIGGACLMFIFDMFLVLLGV